VRDMAVRMELGQSIIKLFLIATHFIILITFFCCTLASATYFKCLRFIPCSFFVVVLFVSVFFSEQGKAQVLVG